ncbi:MAG: hypothetical protein K1Y36_08880 [Blastocatellia bacterium]|nr:hypothetical protein [Blastocatellia bacterium]
MTTLSIIQLIIQIASAVALFLTLLINYRQLRTMSLQVAEMGRPTDAQQILSLLNFIESNEVREARTIVRRNLPGKPFSDWTESEFMAAVRICTTYAATGAVLKSGLVPLEPFWEGLDPSFRQCYRILEPLLREM